MPIELKICGINSKNIIQTIIQNGGCKYLGFIFYPPSPRNLSIEESKKLTSMVPYHIKKVAVLVKPLKINLIIFKYMKLLHLEAKN
jgi:phosphoribosylanthranilate isomerase